MTGKALQFLSGRTLREQQVRAGLFFMLPAIIYVLVFFVAPAGYAVYLSVVDWGINGPRAFVGIENYVSVATDRGFWETVRNTAYLAILEVPGTLICALLTALALMSSTRLRGRTLYRLVYYLPVVTSLIAVAYVWSYLFNPQIGVFNSVLDMFGLPKQRFLTSQEQVIPTLAVIDIWARLGFDMIIFIAGLESVPADYYEAAKIDGANAWSRFWKITLPLLNPQIVLVAVLEVIHALRIFALPYAATAGGPANASRTVVMQIYDKAFRWNSMSEAAVTAIYLFALVLAISIIQRKLLTRAVEY